MEELQQGNQKTINVGNEEYVKFQQWIADTKKRNIADLLKAMKDKVANRRQTMVMRRADLMKYAPDEDVAAYGQVYKLKNPSGEAKNKTSVSDNEIKAYIALDPKFDSFPTLVEISDKITAMKSEGQLTIEGDKTAGEED